MKKIFNNVKRLVEFEKDLKRLSKKFACRSLKGKGVASGIKVIYAYFEQEDVIELVEIYYKGEKENEDRNRLLRNYRDRKVYR